MFEVDKPRRFHYVPRFYDPEKEKWEALKKKYAIEQAKADQSSSSQNEAAEGADDDLAYFQQRLRDLDKEAADNKSRLTWRDLIRKREMPKFNYQPRFGAGAQTEAEETDADNADSESQKLTDKYWQAKRQIKIRRRFDISDSEYMKPISGTTIVVYGFLAFILILIIIAF